MNWSSLNKSINFRATGSGTQAADFTFNVNFLISRLNIFFSDSLLFARLREETLDSMEIS